MRQQALLPLRRQRPGSFAALMAATSMLILLAAAAALALSAATRTIERASAERLIIQVVDANPERRATVADDVLARLNRTKRIISSRRVPDEEARALVAPYIGNVSTSELPLPIMIEVRATDHALVRRVIADLKQVQVTAAGAELAPMLRLIRTLRGIAVGGAVVAAAAAGLIAMLTARATLAREGPTLEILHALGATDRQVSQLVTGKIARDAAIGAAIGFAAAGGMIILIGARIGHLGGGTDTHLGPGSWIFLVALTLALIGLATAAAQGALLSTLRRTP